MIIKEFTDLQTLSDVVPTHKNLYEIGKAIYVSVLLLLLQSRLFEIVMYE